MRLARIRKLIDSGEIVCATSISALLYVLVEHLPAGGAKPGAYGMDHDPGRRYVLPDDLPELF